jgi:hypothetical protein
VNVNEIKWWHWIVAYFATTGFTYHVVFFSYWGLRYLLGAH